MGCEPYASSTRAGPKAYADDVTTASARSGCMRPRTYAGALERTRPAATASGTNAGGSTSSIGTNTSCVGTAAPALTSNSTRAAHA